MFQYTAKQRTIRKSEKFWLTGKGARDATAFKKNGAANVRKIWRKYHKIFRSRCPGGICTNTEMTHEFLGGGVGVMQEFGDSTHSQPCPRPPLSPGAES